MTRATTPELAREPGVFYFDNVTSCGTSTAVSLPCMLSPLGRGRFDLRQAARQTNLLDALKSAGFQVEWRENNTGSQGVAVRVKTIEYSKGWPRYVSAAGRRAPKPGPHPDELCKNGTCFDEIMMSGLADELKAISAGHRDRVPPDGQSRPCLLAALSGPVRGFQAGVPDQPNSAAARAKRSSTPMTIQSGTPTTIWPSKSVCSRRMSATRRQPVDLRVRSRRIARRKRVVPARRPLFHGARGADPGALPAVDVGRLSKAICGQWRLPPGKRSVPLSHDNIYHTVIGGLGIRTIFMTRAAISWPSAGRIRRVTAVRRSVRRGS